MIAYLYQSLDLVLLDASLIVLQAILINRFGLSFAAIGGFAGLGGYLMASIYLGSMTLSISIACGICLLILAIPYASKLLLRDSFLLVSLSVLGLFKTMVASVPTLGGADGTELWRLDSTSAKIGALSLFSFACSVQFVCQSQSFASFVNIARGARQSPFLHALVRTERLLLIAGTAVGVLGAAVGMFRASVTGRMTPEAFSFETATQLLLASLLAGEGTVRVVCIALSYSIIPDLFGLFFGYSSSYGAFVRGIVTALVILVFQRTVRVAPL